MSSRVVPASASSSATVIVCASEAVKVWAAVNSHVENHCSSRKSGSAPIKGRLLAQRCRRVRCGRASYPPAAAAGSGRRTTSGRRSGARRRILRGDAGGVLVAHEQRSLRRAGQQREGHRGDGEHDREPVLQLQERVRRRTRLGEAVDHEGRGAEDDRAQVPRPSQPGRGDQRQRPQQVPDLHDRSQHDHGDERQRRPAHRGLRPSGRRHSQATTTSAASMPTPRVMVTAACRSRRRCRARTRSSRSPCRRRWTATARCGRSPGVASAETQPSPRR